MHKKALTRYAELTQWIRELSAPNIADISSAEEYRDDLLRSFMRISELSSLNENILKEHIYPNLDKDKVLDDEDIEEVREFCNRLMDPTNMGTIDVTMIYVHVQKLLEAANKKDDVRTKIVALDMLVLSAYLMFVTSYRLYPYYDMCTKYRDAGYKAGLEIISYLEKDKFESLPDDFCREIVLINSRYIAALFFWFDKSGIKEERQRDIDILKNSLSIAYDPFYLEMMPEYDWEYHKFRCMDYMSCLTERNNINGYDTEQLSAITENTKELIEFLKDVKSERIEVFSEDVKSHYLNRNLYASGELSKEEYKKSLREIYNRIPQEDYNSINIYLFFNVPIEYLLVVRDDELTKEDKEFLGLFYNSLVHYAYNLPTSQQLTYVVSFISDVFRYFIEVEDGPSFKDLNLQLLAALHPPTYVHSLSVSVFTVTLTKHLIHKKPEKFVGLFGIDDVSEVKSKEEEILKYAEDIALLHDVGKLQIIETVMTYARRLFDTEFDDIKVHPRLGYELLLKYPSTKDYAIGALGHHKWFDDSRGYPDDFKLSECKEEVLVSTLCVADCLDAATDSVGRNYKNAKNLDDYIGELIEGRGTRYADYLVDLIQEEDVYNEIADLLEKAREENYEKTYYLLKEKAS